MNNLLMTFLFYLIILLDTIIIFVNVTRSKCKITVLILFSILFLSSNIFLDTYFMTDSILFTLLSLYCQPAKPLRQHIFYGFYSIIIVDIIFRVIGTFLFSSIMGLTLSEINSSYWIYIAYLLVLPSYFIFIKVFNIDVTLTEELGQENLKKLVYRINAIMISYDFIIHFIPQFDIIFAKFILTYRSNIILVYMSFML